MKSLLRPRPAIPALLALLLLMGGCAKYPPPEPRPPSLHIGPKRLLVLPFHDRSRYSAYDYADDFTRALAEKLTDWTHTTDVVVAEGMDLGTDPFLSGRMPLDVLVQARQEYLADAVVFGTLSELNPYRPLSVTVNIKIVETAEGATLFSHAERWDAAEHEVRRRVEAYHSRNPDAPDGRFGPDIMFNSPRYFLRFVADQIAFRVSRTL